MGRGAPSCSAHSMTTLYLCQYDVESGLFASSVFRRALSDPPTSRGADLAEKKSPLTMPGDANGVEALEGESEADYVARQQRLREEAAERMRAKFGASGGLNGGVRMGGVGSNCSSGGGSWGISDSLSSLGGSLSSLTATVADVASVVKDVAKNKIVSARESVSDKVSFDAMRDLSHLSARGGGGGGGGGGMEGSRDLSDLLGGCSVDEHRASMPSASPHAAAGGRAAPASNSRPIPVGDDFFDDDAWGSTPAKPAAEPVSSSILASPAAPTSVHFSGAAGATPTKRKVAAAKVKSDWDDWGDDKW